MKVKKHLVFSMALAAMGAIASISTLAAVTEDKVWLHEVNLEHGKSGAHIIIDNKGVRIEKSFSLEQLQDDEALHELLADLDDDKRSKIIETLKNIDHQGKMLTVAKGDDVSVEKVIVLNSIKDVELIADSDVKVIKKVLGGDKKHKIIQLHSKEGGSEKAIVHLLKKGQFTQEQLDSIQQALDAKR